MMVHKKLRYYYWLFLTFIKKNAKLVIISFVITFFIIILFINFFPFINVLFFKKKQTIGMVGQYTVNNLPNDILNLISNSLVTINEKGDLNPLLSSSWEITDNNKTYIFHLKPNLYWSDSTRFNAFDIDLQFEGIKTRVVDENTIEFKLNQPLSIFPIYLTRPLTKPPLKGIAGRYQVQNIKRDKNNFITTLNLLPAKSDMPYRTYKFYNNEDDLIAAYKRGYIDNFQTSKKNIADFFSTWKNTNSEKSVNYNQVLTLFFNTQSDNFNSRDIRKVFAQATGRYDDLGVTATSPIPPVSWAFSRNLKTIDFDLEKAKANYRKNKEASESAEINLYTFYDYINVAEKMKANYQTLGVKVNLRVLSYIPNDFDMLLTVWTPPIDPDQYYFWHSTQKDDNITRYHNVKVDKLLEDGRKVTNLDERKKIYKDFQETIIEDLPAYFILHPYVYTIERK